MVKAEGTDGLFDKYNDDRHDNRVERRFQDVNFVIPDLHINDNTRNEEILSWLTRVCKTVFSVGFNLYESEVLDINKVKAYCSENVLRNLIQFSQKN